MSIKFYTTKDEWGCFTNFSRHAVHVDGKDYQTSEHYYQSQKFATTDPVYAEQIRLAPNPKTAANLGRAVRTPAMRSDWDLIKDDIMRKVVRVKFLTHKDAQKTLLYTGDEELIENSAIDWYWGCGADGTGKNMLGKILQEVRKELKDRTALLS